MIDLLARALVGFILAVIVCFLLVPMMYWPSKHDRSRGGVESYERRMEHMEGIRPWIVGVLLAGWPIANALRTRVSWKLTDEREE